LILFFKSKIKRSSERGPSLRQLLQVMYESGWSRLSIHRSIRAIDRTEAPMLIPHDQLEVDTLTRLIEDFVTRDGTDNGDDTPLETRVLRVRQALTKGQALIVFDPESEQCQLMLKHDVPKHLFD
jgi:uncharacterized protein YheU (UPF0270 family)